MQFAHFEPQPKTGFLTRSQFKLALEHFGAVFREGDEQHFFEAFAVPVEDGEHKVSTPSSFLCFPFLFFYRGTLRWTETQPRIYIIVQCPLCFHRLTLVESQTGAISSFCCRHRGAGSFSSSCQVISLGYEVPAIRQKPTIGSWNWESLVLYSIEHENCIFSPPHGGW